MWFKNKGLIATLVVGVGFFGTPASAQPADRSAQNPSIANPHPELPGFPETWRSNKRIYENLFNRHPEPTTPSESIFSTAGSPSGAQVTPAWGYSRPSKSDDEKRSDSRVEERTVM